MSLDVKIIQSSFEQVKELGPKAIAKFYEILFSDHPEAKMLFARVDMEKQSSALFRSLDHIVGYLNDEKKLYEYLFNMGKRHVDYGAEEVHYDLVGASLLKTFAFFFQEAWTADLEDQWAAAFGAVKAIMLEGQASLAEPDLRARARGICANLLLDVLESELDERVIEEIRKKVRGIIYACLEEEEAKLLKKAG